LKHQTHSPGQTSTGQRDEHETKPRFHHTRPETHQNLIHPDKEQNRRYMTINGTEMFSLRRTTPSRSRDLSARYSILSRWVLPPVRSSRARIQIGLASRSGSHPDRARIQKRTSGTRLRPSGGFRPHGHCATVFAKGEPVEMETTGFEPVTPCLQSRCSTS
jgi:hypothetical protein